MAKGLSLIELKNELDTEAQKKVLKLEQMICELKEHNTNISEVLASRNKLIGQLQNRCKALTQGSLCMVCGLKNECNTRFV